jgi:hypothetical protein
MLLRTAHRVPITTPPHNPRPLACTFNSSRTSASPASSSRAAASTHARVKRPCALVPQCSKPRQRERERERPEDGAIRQHKARWRGLFAFVLGHKGVGADNGDERTEGDKRRDDRCHHWRRHVLWLRVRQVRRHLRPPPCVTVCKTPTTNNNQTMHNSLLCTASPHTRGHCAARSGYAHWASAACTPLHTCTERQTRV